MNSLYEPNNSFLKVSRNYTGHFTIHVFDNQLYFKNNEIICINILSGILHTSTLEIVLFTNSFS